VFYGTGIIPLPSRINTHKIVFYGIGITPLNVTFAKILSKHV